MLAMRVETRKLQKLGASSLIVTLPKEWVKRHGLKPGDTVYIVDMGDELRVGVVGELEDNAVVDVGAIGVRGSIRGLTCLYIMGFNGTTLQIDGINVIELSKIKDAVKKLPGFEIVEEDEDRIRISYVADPDRFNLKLSVKAMGVTVARIADLVSALIGKKAGKEDVIKAISSIRDELMRSQHLVMRHLIGRIVRGDSNAYAILMGTGLLGLVGDLLLSIAEYLAKTGLESLEAVGETIRDVTENIPILASILVSPSRKRAQEMLEWVARLWSKVKEFNRNCESMECMYLAAKLEDVVRVMYIIANIAYCSGFASEVALKRQERS